MKKAPLKKLFLALSCLFASVFFSAALAALEAPESFSRFVLSNGMTVCVYEDFSAPTVRVEYAAKAGFSSQSAVTAGFAPLYAELFSKAGLYANGSDEWLLDGLKSECAADSARYSIDISPNQIEETFKELSLCAFAPIFQDQELGEKLRKAKEEAAQNAFSAEGFINSAIDSRVFSSAPWKHDSGIYPALFQKQSLSEARSILTEMARSLYSPQNSGLFVTGAVTKESALFLAEKTFGSYAPQPFLPPSETNAEETSAERKFVLSDPELSPDMAQTVFEYTSLSMEQADIASVILNQRNSALKAALTSEAALNIRGSDYVNVDAAHKNSSSRLIIQSLLEKSSADDFFKAALFEKTLKEKIHEFSEEEFNGAKAFLATNFELAAGNPRGFMELFSQFWAIDGIAKKSYEQSGQNGDDSSLVQRFLARPQRIQAQGYEELKFALQNEEPFEFILINSKNYQNSAAAFGQNGWQSVTAKNASWHAQKMFAAIKDSLEPKGQENEDGGSPKIFDPLFMRKTLESAKSASLKNGIGLYAKTLPERSTSAVAIYIKGGEAECAQKEPGLEAVLASVLAQNARKAVAQKTSSGQMKGAATISADCQDASALVTVECLSGDEEKALEALSDAMIFSEIVPAEVDVYLAGRKSAQIIKTSAMPRQLYSAGIKAFYKQPLYKALHSSKQEILDGVSYTQILESYAKLIDAGRLEIIAVGNFSFEALADKAQELFGSLSRSWQEKPLFAQAKTITKPSQKVKVNHTFLTDISADKAGPRPAVLIPTTDFADPVQYWFNAPSDERGAALFDALFLELRSLCQKAFARSERYDKMSARIEEKSPLVAFGALTFFNVKYISDADAILQEALLNLKEEIAGGGQDGDPGQAGSPNPNGEKSGAALDKIKSRWLKSAFEKADQNLEAAKAIAKKLDEARVREKAFDFPKALSGDYENVTRAESQDFLAVYEACFGKYCKFYSADAKK